GRWVGRFARPVEESPWFTEQVPRLVRGVAEKVERSARRRRALPSARNRWIDRFALWRRWQNRAIRPRHVCLEMREKAARRYKNPFRALGACEIRWRSPRR